MPANNLSYQFKTSSIIIKLIVINAIVFILFPLIAFLSGMSSDFVLKKWFVLPETFSEFILQPWSLITYAFLHADFWHIFWNMLLLYFLGRFVLNLFSPKRFLTIYLLGGIVGGLLYMLAYNVFPAFAESRGYLQGASAAVTAIVIFIGTYTPNTVVRLIFFNVKLWQVAVFFVVADLIRLPASDNAGGLIAHLGGALLGYVYARQLAQGKEIGSGFEKLMDGFANLFKPRRKKPFKTVHRTTRAASGRSKESEAKSDHQKKVDAILDKIGKSGYDSLTKAEKDFLFKAGKED